MSIYATLWRLKFPRHGDDHSGCDWITVLAQGVPAHVGTSSPGPESEPEDPYSAFLPPASTAPTDDDDQTMSAVVFITEGTSKGTATYATIPFEELHQLICDALRGDRPRLVAEVRGPGGGGRLLFEDGSVQGTGRG